LHHPLALLLTVSVLCCVLLCSAVIRLLARLAAFAPERFAQDYLVKCILHLLAVLKHTGG
jgi:hypothetical protein